MPDGFPHKRETAELVHRRCSLYFDASDILKHLRFPYLLSLFLFPFLDYQWQKRNLLYVDEFGTSTLYYIMWRMERMDIVRVFGNNVRKYRMALGLSQEAFADKCGLHRTYISAVECFRRSIALENIQRIANALEIEPYKLFMEEKNDA